MSKKKVIDKSSPKSNWFNFDKMKKRKEKTRKILPPYTCPTGTEIFGLMIEAQNKELLLKIAKDKEMSIDETDELLKLFLKPSYFLPQVTANKKKEISG